MAGYDSADMMSVCSARKLVVPQQETCSEMSAAGLRQVVAVDRQYWAAACLYAPIMCVGFELIAYRQSC